MPELPEAERARQAIDRVLGREIVAVDDRDTYVCRPHPPGEIAAALVGETLLRTHRRGKFIWVETTGPVLGLHLGMSGRIDIDAAPAEKNWDRFAIEFAGGGRLALNDRRRLGASCARRCGRRSGSVGRTRGGSWISGARTAGARGAAARWRAVSWVGGRRTGARCVSRGEGRAPGRASVYVNCTLTGRVRVGRRGAGRV
jgi:hypothetical protein